MECHAVDRSGPGGPPGDVLGERQILIGLTEWSSPHVAPPRTPSSRAFVADASQRAGDESRSRCAPEHSGEPAALISGAVGSPSRPFPFLFMHF